MADFFIIHGNAMVMFGYGILITGDSGSGKTTLCFELLQRGHSIIADDAVVLHHTDNRTIASAPLTSQNKIALTPKRIVSIKDTFGANSLILQHPLHFHATLGPPSHLCTQKKQMPHLIQIPLPNPKDPEAFELLIRNAIDLHPQFSANKATCRGIPELTDT